ncbi:flagellar biosynthesis protein FlhF [Heliorestis convoluta]|uniref:Flagellar biosynthesis protein FlhF n=1 Tax=Heliorestis convoluta TaxID=356322 RepID=A0A5Q2MZJ3_9FIRM|nr:flagellar biosynthesis protein FlhF [Heliorestis convoluta]QGG48188.1 flagellar biosynthesis protein FlhF [Heliorestis convoluta]
MRVKRFVAKTMQEAMNKMKSEMGQDAVILHTRKIKEGGIMGFFAKEMFEVTGAIENIPVGAKKKATNPPKLQPVVEEALAALENDKTARSESWKDSKLLLPQKSNDDGVKKEISQMKTMMGEILQRLTRDKNELPSEFQQLQKELVDNEVDPKLAQNIITEIYREVGDTYKDQEFLLRQRLHDKIKKMLGTAKPFFTADGNRQEIFILVGPTGVGKTTTVAKLAATFSIVDKRKVGLITVDTYRIAAVEQLKTFGEIIGVPVDVVFTPDALDAAILRHRDKDLLLIDTAGRSYKNDEQIEELKGFADAYPHSKVMLVLSLATKYADLEKIIERFSFLNIDRYLFTKLDETNHYGSILNILHKTKKPVSYVTTGQNVPDDMEIADTNKLAKLICGETDL